MTYNFNLLDKQKIKLGYNERMYRYIVNKVMRYGQGKAFYYFQRGMTLYIKENNNKKGLIGCEIGVHRGVNSEVMLKSLPIKKLYCIDPYTDFSEETNNKISHKTIHFKNEAVKRLSKYGDKVKFIFKPSEDVYNNFEDNYFNFVYIDGNHDLIDVDIKNYYPKTKWILGGHDFHSSKLNVVNGVIDFSNKYNFKLFGGRDGDWWIVKEK